MSKQSLERAARKTSDQGSEQSGWAAPIATRPPADSPVYSESQLNAAVEEAKFEILASIRGRLRSLPTERRDQMLSDFDKAVKSKSIGYLADTITNWALGGRGYDYAGAIVNRSLEFLPDLDEDPELLAVWQEYKAGLTEGE